jgi:hypothetical protein
VTSYKHRFDFVYFAKKILANQTHLNASMDLMDIAGKQNFRQMSSRGFLKIFGETNELQKDVIYVSCVISVFVVS